ncbi:hypothetical protein [Streptomyces avermitilis]|nr:hypothetical protein [Streptomyces avermitilis]
MPVVLIHGVHDTHRVWGGVRRHLIRSEKPAEVAAALEAHWTA